MKNAREEGRVSGNICIERAVLEAISSSHDSRAVAIRRTAARRGRAFFVFYEGAARLSESVTWMTPIDNSSYKK